MKLEEQIQAEFERAGLTLDEALLKQLVPMCQRWQNYIKEAREIDVREAEPAHVFCPRSWGNRFPAEVK